MGELEHQRALEQLFAEHERSLFNVAYRYVWNAEDARDVVQDAFVRLWRKRDRIDWPRATGLAYAIVLGIAANRRRGERLRRAITGWWSDDGDRVADSTASPDHQLADAMRDRRARAAIDALPERLRSVLVMSTFSGLDHAAIASILDVPVGTIGSRRHEAIARVKQAIEEEPR